MPVEGSHRYASQLLAGWVLSAGIDCNPSGLHCELWGVHFPLAFSHAYPALQSASTVQLVLHSLSPQEYAPHAVVVAGLHVPVPSHVRAEVAVPAAQLSGSPHGVARPPLKPAHLVRSLVLSHASALHTSPPPSSHFVREPCGSPLTPTHFPSAPFASHASHWLLHSDSQQTPSTQYPLPHSVAPEHAVPLVFTHLPALAPGAAPHTEPVGHDASSQHTREEPPPSTQCLLVHSESSVHTVPGAPVVTQTPALQM